MRIVYNNISIRTHHRRYNPTHADAETFDAYIILYGRVYISAHIRRRVFIICPLEVRKQNYNNILYYTLRTILCIYS